MEFDLEVTGGEWFQFFESHFSERGEIVYDDPAGDARVCIRSIMPFFEEVQGGKKKKFEWVLNTQTRAMERVGYYPEQTAEDIRREREDAYDYAITAWENFTVKGKLIECTRENKIKLMKVPVFDRFVARCFQLLSGAGVKQQEAEEKN